MKYKNIGKIELASFILLLFGQQGFSQNNKSTILHSIISGVSAVSVTDSYSGLLQKNLIATDMAYNYSKINAYRKKEITAAWSTGQSTKVKLNDFRIEYTDGWSVIKNKAGRFNTYIGYSISTNPLFIKTPDNSGKQYSWATSNTLSAYSSSFYSWKNNTISLDISLPIAGLASRPMEHTVYKEDINGLLYNSYDNLYFTSLHNLKAATISLHYSTILSKRFSLQAGYNYRYSQLTKNDLLFKQVTHGLQAGFSYRLK